MKIIIIPLIVGTSGCVVSRGNPPVQRLQVGLGIQKATRVSSGLFVYDYDKPSLCTKDGSQVGDQNPSLYNGGARHWRYAGHVGECIYVILKWGYFLELFVFIFSSQIPLSSFKVM